MKKALRKSKNLSQLLLFEFQGDIDYISKHIFGQGALANEEVRLGLRLQGSPPLALLCKAAKITNHLPNDQI